MDHPRGNTGNAFAINAAGQVTLATPAALPNPGGMQLVVRATDNAGASGDGLVNVICNAPAQGVVEQRWNGSDAFWSENWTGTTAYSGTLAAFTTAQNVADNYSRRLTGYLKPQVTGDYTFWVAGDDDCRLYLSSDGSPSNKSQIASVGGWTNFQSWDSQAGQKSAVIPLQAGKVYWLEAQQVEGGGGDHLSVAWQGPGISRQAIPSSVIFPNVAGVNFDNPPVPPTLALTSPVEGSAFDAGDNITLEAAVAGGSIAVTSVDFYRGATLIGSDATAPYSAIWNSALAGSHALTARAVYSGGGVTSSATGITVADTDPASDPDGDGFTTGLELALGTDPDSAASQPSPLYANLRAWWKLDESTGSTADDTTGRPGWRGRRCGVGHRHHRRRARIRRHRRRRADRHPGRVDRHRRLLAGRLGEDRSRLGHRHRDPAARGRSHRLPGRIHAERELHRHREFLHLRHQRLPVRPDHRGDRQRRPMAPPRRHPQRDERQDLHRRCRSPPPAAARSRLSSPGRCRSATTTATATSASTDRSTMSGSTSAP